MYIVIILYVLYEIFITVQNIYFTTAMIIQSSSLGVPSRHYCTSTPQRPVEYTIALVSCNDGRVSYYVQTFSISEASCTCLNASNRNSC